MKSAWMFSNLQNLHAIDIDNVIDPTSEFLLTPPNQPDGRFSKPMTARMSLLSIFSNTGLKQPSLTHG